MIINPYIFTGIQNEYYVASSGAGDGSSSSSPASPATFLSDLSGLSSGMTVFFKKGDTFDLNVPVGTGLVFDAYSSGADPIIRGSESLSALTWTEESSGLWYATVSNVPQGVVLDGVRRMQAQTSFIIVTSRPSTTQVSASSSTLNALDAVESLVGADIVAKEFGFRPTFRRQITAYSSGTLTINAAFQNNNAPGAGYGFKLLNHKSFVSTDGDWAYYSATNRLYIKSVANPNTRGVRAIVEDYGFELSNGVSGIEIRNIELKEYGKAGIYSDSNNDLIISGCTVHDTELNGIHLIGNSNNILVDDNVVHGCKGNGIHIGGITNSTISNNEIYNIGTQSGISVPYYTDIFRSVGCGIHSRWDETVTPSVMTDVTIEYNYIHDVGYIGIAFCGTDNIIQYNYVENFLTKWNDGGGIYCINRPYGTGYATDHCTIRYNIVENGVGNLDGITAESTLHAEGIYVDNGSSYITIDNNQVKNMPDYGIMLNFDTSLNTVTNNTVSDCETAAVSFREDTSFDYGPYNPDWEVTFVNNVSNVLTGNTLVANSTSQVCVEAYSFNNNNSYNPFSSGGDTDNNLYVSPYRSNIARHHGTADNLFTLSGWQTKFSDDASSTELKNFLLYVNEPSAMVDILHELNPTNSSVSSTPGSNYMLTNKSAAGTQSIAAYTGRIYLPIILVEDNFTGASGNITGHTPDIGGTWVVGSGAMTINGSGKLIASSVGEVYQNVSNKNTTVTAVGRVTTINNAISIVLRYTDSNNYVQVQLLINGVSSAVKLINRVGGTSTEIVSETSGVGSLTINTDYTLKAKVVNNEIWVHFNNVQFINDVDTGLTDWGANNPTGTNHGLRVGTVAQIDYTEIVGGFN